MKGTDSRTMAGRNKANATRPADRKDDPVKRPAFEVDGFSDDYLSVVAHDLRGSLNSIIGWAELIKRKAVTISLLDEEHNPTMVWKLANAFPVKITSTDLKAEGNEVAIETLEIAHEGLTIENG